jgi:hypothetical protein
MQRQQGHRQPAMASQAPAIALGRSRPGSPPSPTQSGYSQQTRSTTGAFQNREVRLRHYRSSPIPKSVWKRCSQESPQELCERAHRALVTSAVLARLGAAEAWNSPLRPSQHLTAQDCRSAATARYSKCQKPVLAFPHRPRQAGERRACVHASRRSHRVTGTPASRCPYWPKPSARSDGRLI